MKKALLAILALGFITSASAYSYNRFGDMSYYGYPPTNNTFKFKCATLYTCAMQGMTIRDNWNRLF